MRIAIDLQALQFAIANNQNCNSSIAFISDLLSHKGTVEIYLILSGQLPETLSYIRNEFDQMIPQDRIKVWYSPGPVSKINPSNGIRRKSAEIIHSSFLDSLSPDVVHYLGPTKNFETEIIWHRKNVGKRVVVTSDIQYSENLVRASLVDSHKSKIDNYSLDLELRPSCVSLLTSRFLHDEDTAPPEYLKINGRNISADQESDKNYISPRKPDVGFRSSSKVYISRIARLWESALSNQGNAEVISRRKKLSLAFVSPLPPERTGIADYSADLLPDLSDYYEITVITNQRETDVPDSKGDISVRSPEWFANNARLFDRVVYQLGNSSYHDYMPPLLNIIPGVVVLHDFYLYDLFAYLHYMKGELSCLPNNLYLSHGYNSVSDFYTEPENARWRYPANFSILGTAKGIITHSKYSKSLAREWYDNSVSANWQMIPLVRNLESSVDRKASKQDFGISEQAFVVCSFGHMGESKLNLALLRAWTQSALAKEEQSVLIFVGQLQSDSYGQEVLDFIEKSEFKNKIRITGFVDKEEYLSYLSIADCAVQLRCKSRGETSAAVLDCMGGGLPLIVNANGSMSELNKSAVVMLPDEFSDLELSNKLEEIWQKRAWAKNIGNRAKDIVNNSHNPRFCSEQYFKTIEKFYAGGESSIKSTCDEISDLVSHIDDQEFKREVAISIDRTFAEIRPARTLYLDVSITAGNDYKTGIQRVVRAITQELIKNSSQPFRVEPVKITDSGGRWNYATAPEFTLGLLDVPSTGLDSEIVKPVCGDIILVLDLTGRYLSVTEEAGLYRRFRADGAKVFSVVYDVLPLTMPNVFPSYAADEFRLWLKSVCTLDGAICISNAVANDLSSVLNDGDYDYGIGKEELSIKSFQLGADIENSSPTKGLPLNSKFLLNRIARRPTFLMVGTIEPRKGHLAVIDAFTKLWDDGYDVNLLIVGKEGWLGLESDVRRNVSVIVDSIKHNKNLNKNLFWVSSASDEYLDRMYASSTCLIAGSYGEGFGLPLIEAAQHQLPIIARDIPVFREVAGDHAYYFNSDDPEELSGAISHWLQLHKKYKHPTSDNMPWLTWKESAAQLLDALIDDSDQAQASGVEAGLERESQLQRQA